jgi:hypothetical protein
LARNISTMLNLQYFGQFFSCFGNESSKFPKHRAYPGFGKPLRFFPKQPTIQALFKNCPNYCIQNPGFF